MTPPATQTAWKAIRFCTLPGRPAVSARKIGVIPGGSMMTNRVRKSEPKTATSNMTELALQKGVDPGAGHGRARGDGKRGRASDSAGPRDGERARRPPRDLPVHL